METSKAGSTREKKQRFYCRGCRRFFRENPEAPEGKTNYRAKAPHDLPSAARLIMELRAIAQELGRTPTTTVITEWSKEKRA